MTMYMSAGHEFDEAVKNSTPSQYRKKPVVIEAMLFKGNGDAVLNWVNEGQAAAKRLPATWWPVTDETNVAWWGLMIPTLEGQHIASPGDYIIRGVAGEHYPCKPDIFAATYETV